jgi:hypothetical protein
MGWESLTVQGATQNSSGKLFRRWDHVTCCLNHIERASFFLNGDSKNDNPLLAINFSRRIRQFQLELFSGAGAESHHSRARPYITFELCSFINPDFGTNDAFKAYKFRIIK